VVTGNGDTTAAGIVLDYRAHPYIGTSAWLSCHVPPKRADVLHNIASLPAVVPNRYWVATVQDVAGKAIDRLVGLVVYPQDGMLDAHRAPQDALARLNAVTAPTGVPSSQVRSAFPFHRKAPRSHTTTAQASGAAPSCTRSAVPGVEPGAHRGRHRRTCHTHRENHHPSQPTGTRSRHLPERRKIEANAHRITPH
jgi:hypothetical protein